MPNQLSGQTGPSPMSYAKHLRYSPYARFRHSKQLAAFLALYATKLSSTAATIYAKLVKYGAARVKAATNISQLP